MLFLLIVGSYYCCSHSRRHGPSCAVYCTVTVGYFIIIFANITVSTTITQLSFCCCAAAERSAIHQRHRRRTPVAVVVTRRIVGMPGLPPPLAISGEHGECHTHTPRRRRCHPHCNCCCCYCCWNVLFGQFSGRRHQHPVQPPDRTIAVHLTPSWWTRRRWPHPPTIKVFSPCHRSLSIRGHG